MNDGSLARLGGAAKSGEMALTSDSAELEEHWDGAGEPLTIRPVRPEDAERHRAFFERLSPEDVRLRFFATMRELTPAQLDRFTRLDDPRDMALIAVRETTGETVGVARLTHGDAPGIDEFAVIVESAMKGKGLGRHLMRRLIGWARAHGLAEIRGEILAENTPMLTFARHLGFTLHYSAGSAEIVEARLVLDQIANPPES